jgi:hypothetical protein
VLSQQNGGVFPVDRVKEAMYSTRPIPAHGTPEMPACGAVLDSLKSSPRDYEARVRDIAAHAVLIGREVVRRRDPPG